MEQKNNISFLGEVASHLMQKHGGELSNCWLVFPGNRARLFFMKELATHLDRPVWAPVSMTISDLAYRLSGYSKADPLQLLMKLYRVYGSSENFAESFDEFYLFGEILLKDFDDIDSNLVDAGSIFRNLENLRSIEDDYSYMDEEQLVLIKSFWESFTASRESEEKLEFSTLWARLLPLYAGLRKSLEDSGTAYEGLAYRRSVELLGQEGFSGADKVYFIGFNALTLAEKKIFSLLRKMGKAGFYWDGDTAYTGDPGNEAGFFLRENTRLFPDERGKTGTYLSSDKNIEVISAPGNTAQVKEMSSVLSHWCGNDSIEASNTAVILPDEGLLPMVMNSIPACIKDVNITMGYPLSASAAYSLVEGLLELQQGMKKGAVPGKEVFYNKDVLRLLGHQYILSLGEAALMLLRKDILKRNLVFPSAGYLGVDKLSSMIFRPAGDSMQLGDYINSILDKFLELSGDGLQQEYINGMRQLVEKLSDILSKNAMKLKVATYRKLLKKLAGSTKLPFSGEPLRGLQVMGILESRALDFKNLVVLSVNEGLFPGNPMVNSLIPYNIRKAFFLPTPEYRDRIYAYYFYRLLQRAGDVRLFYVTGNEGYKSREKSRFLYQLKYLSELKLNERSIVSHARQKEERSIVVKKGKQEMKALKRYLKGGERKLSPSALNSYLDCPMKFYFRYIAGIGEADEVNEDVNALLFGDIIHDVLYEVYKPWVDSGKQLVAEDIAGLASNREGLMRKLDDAVARLWLKQKGGSRDEKRIVKEVILKYIDNVFSYDKSIAPVEMLGLEKEVRMEVDIAPEGDSNTIVLGGVIDRIDKPAGSFPRVIDYKSGTVKKNFRSVEDLFNRDSSDRRKEIFQTMLYCLMNGEDAVMPGLYNIRQMHDKAFSPGIRLDRKLIDNLSPLTEGFRIELKELLEEIFDSRIAFRQTDEKDKCKNCMFNKICAREEILK